MRRAFSAATAALVFAILLVSVPAAAQQGSAEAPAIRVDDGRTLTIETFTPEGRRAIEFDPAEIASFVIVFSASPLAPIAHTGAGKLDVAAAAVDAEHDRFREDLRAIVEVASKRGGSAEARITRSYRDVLNGVALTTRRDVAAHLATLPYVAGVHEDVVVRTSDEASNTVIGADRARTELGATGSGIVVAVIDTGVDYLHPALGGGRGAAYKVVGGYDFVDDDADPMDGHGHGTHVAGIVAGDDGGAFRGVAPDARILAYRVLDNSGTGQSSSVIAGIERAVQDGAHVINLSLGGWGHADDPTSLAVDNATAAGVVAVVAAGNDGRSFAIGSPGTARSAITVGATDNEDALAHFSSRGPTSLGFENKPDVMAPGVQINSTVLDGRYAQYSGTSMATPHVAGAAALLLQRHPAWSPRDVKSALTHTARDVGLNLWTQGTGRIDIMAADGSRASVHPASLSFGNLDPSQNLVQQTRTITVRNLSSSSQTWTASAQHSIPGTSMTLSSGSVTVAAGGTASVTVTARFEPQKIAFPTRIDEPYAGTIRFVSGASTIEVPFSVTKTPQLTLTFEDPPFSVEVLGPHGGVASAMNPGLVASFPIAAGTYDVMVVFAVPADDWFTPAFVVREGVLVTGKHTLDIRRSDLKNELRFAAAGPGGAAVPIDLSRLSLERKASGATSFYTYSTSLRGNPVILTSDISTRFKIEALMMNMADEAGDAHLIPFSISGIANSTTLQNSAAFRSVTTSFVVPDDVEELFVVPHDIRISGEQFMTIAPSFAVNLADRHRLSRPFTRTVHYGARPAPDFGYRYSAYQVHNTTGGTLPAFLTDSNLLFIAPIHEATSTNLVQYAYHDFENPLRTSDSATTRETMGAGPVAFVGRMWNIGSISTVRFSIRRASLFTGSAGEAIGGEITYRVRDASGAIVASAVNDNRFVPPPLWLPAGRYDLEAEFEGGHVDERSVRARVRTSFETTYFGGEYDPDPPLIESLHLTSAGERVTALEGAGPHAVVAVVRDTYNAGGPQLRAVGEAGFRVRRLGETDWMSLPATRSGDRFTMTLPEDLPLGYYDFGVSALDLGGNPLEYEVMPGFRLGSAEGREAPRPAQPLSPENWAFVRLHEASGPLTFSWSEGGVGEGLQMRYVFRMSGEGLDTTVTTSGAELTLDVLDDLVEGADYQWWVETTDGFALAPSEAFTLRARGLNVSNDDTNGLPTAFELLAAYPNPFNPTTTITFSVPAQRHVLLAVYDVTGRRIATLADEPFGPGRHERRWDAAGHPSGLYLIRMEGAGEASTRTVVLVK